MKRPRRKPSKIQSDILAFVLDYRSKHDGNSPGLDRIAEGVHMSRTGVYNNMQSHPVLFRDEHNNLCVRH
jgi:hypothetical protein